MQRAAAAVIVEQAIDRLIAEQPELLDINVGERALCHQLALYMTNLVPLEPRLRTDCEYNRHGAEAKRLNLPQRDAMDREVRARTAFPDIIVHERQTDDHNEIVLEVKQPGEDLRYDTLKLRQFRDFLGYKHPAHVILGYDEFNNLIREVHWQDD
jgi:hypothetical protein